MTTRPWLASLLLVAAGCGDSKEARVPPTCGLAAVAAASTLLEQFTIPNRTLASPPASLPERAVARVVADGAFPTVVGRADSMLVIGVEGDPPAEKLGFGVLVVDPSERVQGVMLYEGSPIPGAPRLGEVSIGARRIPLIGVQADPGSFTDPSCPSLFPDSVLQ
ncbi:MAG TPA: hypothetical protein VH764_00995 [Gemmatimonadales bacterium]|jgi:hypothetical protein